ncbi:MAG: hypothetical protein DRR19_31085 [Candidatus Parabeggiatoa sp. nov. 1]|nr:MAG: hypothetical protein DRR19_31085 [Gammaproteobacteria bacterium]
MRISKNRSIQILISLGVIALLYFPGLGCFHSSRTSPKSPPIEHSSVKHQTITYPDGSRYEGSVLNNQPHGNGVMAYPDGRRYFGVFYHGKPQGPGTMQYPDGRHEKGTWGEDQQFHKI